MKREEKNFISLQRIFRYRYARVLRGRATA